MPIAKRRTIVKPLFVGESNPYGGDDYYALVPYPDGCSGHRLCRLILGLTDDEYMDRFRRCNLVRGPWSVVKARERAAELKSGPGPFILLGSNVCTGWGIPYRPFETFGNALVLPHPSGRNTMWRRPDATWEAREAVRRFIEEYTSARSET